jgi:uncharacterized protein YecT (DUF1311 family)
MKRFTAFFAAAFLAIALVPAASAARLPDAEYTRMMKACPEFAAADKRMNAAWKALGQAAKPEKMEEYKEWQAAWAGEKRQELVARMVAAKSVPKAAVKGGRVNKDLAYAVVTNERAMWLEELAKQEKDANYLPRFTGSIYYGKDGPNESGATYLTFLPDGWWTELLLCYADRADRVPFLQNLIDAVEKSEDGEVFGVTVKGRLTSARGYDWNDETPDLAKFGATIAGAKAR